MTKVFYKLLQRELEFAGLNESADKLVAVDTNIYSYIIRVWIRESSHIDISILLLVGHSIVYNARW